MIDDFAIQGLSRHAVREHVDKAMGMTREKQHVKQLAGETRRQRYERLMSEQGDTMPERIG